MSMKHAVSHAVRSMAVVVFSAAPGSAGDCATLSEDWEVHYNAGDAAAVAALYTEDGKMMPPFRAAAQGKEAIEASLKEEIAANAGTTLHLESQEYGKDGNLGYASGIFWVTDGEGNTVDKGKWLELRKMVDGEWKISYDIWNSDMPMPGTGE